MFSSLIGAFTYYGVGKVASNVVKGTTKSIDYIRGVGDKVGDVASVMVLKHKGLSEADAQGVIDMVNNKSKEELNTLVTTVKEVAADKDVRELLDKPEELKKVIATYKSYRDATSYLDFGLAMAILTAVLLLIRYFLLRAVRKRRLPEEKRVYMTRIYNYLVAMLAGILVLSGELCNLAVIVTKVRVWWSTARSVMDGLKLVRSVFGGEQTYIETEVSSVLDEDIDLPKPTKCGNEHCQALATINGACEKHHRAVTTVIDRKTITFKRLLRRPLKEKHIVKDIITIKNTKREVDIPADLEERIMELVEYKDDANYDELMEKWLTEHDPRYRIWLDEVASETDTFTDYLQAYGGSRQGFYSWITCKMNNGKEQIHPKTIDFYSKVRNEFKEFKCYCGYKTDIYQCAFDHLDSHIRTAGTNRLNLEARMAEVDAKMEDHNIILYSIYKITIMGVDPKHCPELRALEYTFPVAEKKYSQAYYCMKLDELVLMHFTTFAFRAFVGFTLFVALLIAAWIIYVKYVRPTRRRREVMYPNYRHRAGINKNVKQPCPFMSFFGVCQVSDCPLNHDKEKAVPKEKVKTLVKGFTFRCQYAGACRSRAAKLACPFVHPSSRWQPEGVCEFEVIESPTPPSSIAYQDVGDPDYASRHNDNWFDDFEEPQEDPDDYYDQDQDHHGHNDDDNDDDFVQDPDEEPQNPSPPPVMEPWDDMFADGNMIFRPGEVEEKNLPRDEKKITINGVIRTDQTLDKGVWTIEQRNKVMYDSIDKKVIDAKVAEAFSASGEVLEETLEAENGNPVISVGVVNDALKSVFEVYNDKDCINFSRHATLVSNSLMTISHAPKDESGVTYYLKYSVDAEKKEDSKNIRVCKKCSFLTSSNKIASKIVTVSGDKCGCGATGDDIVNLSQSGVKKVWQRKKEGLASLRETKVLPFVMDFGKNNKNIIASSIEGVVVKLPVPNELKSFKTLKAWAKPKPNESVAIVVQRPKPSVKPGVMTDYNTGMGTPNSTNGDCGAPWINQYGVVVGIHMMGDPRKRLNGCVHPGMKHAKLLPGNDQ